MAALDHVGQRVLHVVAEIVEAELVVRAVGYVAGVGGAALGVVEPVHDLADREAEEAIDLAHPLRVAVGEVVVDGHDVNAAALEGVEIDGRGGHQRLAFASPHLGDAALVQDHAADQLDVEMPQAQGAFRPLADRGESLGQDVVQLGAVGDLLAEVPCALAQGVVRQGLGDRLQRVDALDDGLEGPDLAIVDRPEDFLGDPEHLAYPLPA